MHGTAAATPAAAEAASCNGRAAATHGWGATADVSATTGGILLSMATANVRSLEPAELRLAQRAGLRTNLKIEVLDREFHDAGFHIVCVQ